MAPPRRWRNWTANTGLLLFAQRVEELLFDYTLDSYRAPALNTHYRAVELTDAIEAVQKGLLKQPAIAPIAEELADSISHDEVAKQLLAPLPEAMASSSFWNSSHLPEMLTRARFVVRHFSRGRYKSGIVAHLQELLPEAKEKERILALTRDLVVEWLNEEHPPGSIYYHCRRYFFDPSGPTIIDTSALQGFVDLFSGPKEKWTVIFRAQKSFSALKDFLGHGFAEVLDSVAARTKAPREREFVEHAHDGVYLSMEVEASDALSARRAAERRLAVVSDFALLHVHRVPFAWDAQVLVRRGDTLSTIIEEPISPILKCPDCAQTELEEKLISTLVVFSPKRLDRDSLNRVGRALSLHSAAVKSEAVENQLLNLWSALETLLPIDAAESRIARVLELLVPVLSRGYPVKLVRDVGRQLQQATPVAYADALSRVPEPGSGIERLAALLSIRANWPLWEPVFATLGDNPLLRNRVFEVAKQVVDLRELRSLIQAHEQRVRWHLNRIYRIRNFLTHSGRRLPHVAAVVENLHTYIHQLLEHLQSVLTSQTNLRTIDEALLRVRLEHQAHVALLSRASEVECAPETFRAFLFGPGGV